MPNLASRIERIVMSFTFTLRSNDHADQTDDRGDDGSEFS